jgi:hypothetical protein
MYTKIDDWRMAKKINEYLNIHPAATQKNICEELATTHYRLLQLERDNLIDLEYTKRNLSSL